MIDRVITIGELSRRTGIPSSTLRYWELVKVLPKPMRISGQRRYSPEAADLVAVLQLAQACGFSLPEMRRLLHGFQPGTTASERWRTTARDHRQVLEEKIARLKAMSRLLRRLEQCECLDLAVCGRRAKNLLDSRRPRNNSHGAVRDSCEIAALRIKHGFGE
jgi:MerR family redox-sensitive transcriptional activator SoxR